MPITRYTPSDYAKARALWEANHTLAHVTEQTGIPGPRISKVAKAEGWTKKREDVIGQAIEKKPEKQKKPTVLAVEYHGHTVTDESKRLVHGMAGFGLAEDQVAIIIGISVEQLRASYPHELATAKLKTLAKVTQSLYQMATDVNRPNVAAAKYLHEVLSGAEEAGALGKKEIQNARAKLAAVGKFAPSEPPKLVVNNK